MITKRIIIYGYTCISKFLNIFFQASITSTVLKRDSHFFHIFVKIRLAKLLQKYLTLFKGRILFKSPNLLCVCRCYACLDADVLLLIVWKRFDTRKWRFYNTSPKTVNLIRERLHAIRVSRERSHVHNRVSPSDATGGIPPLAKKLACLPHVTPPALTQQCRFCHFHAVFGHFA